VIGELETFGLLDTRAAARELGLKVDTVQKMIRRGRLDAIRLKSDSGGTIAWLVPKTAIERVKLERAMGFRRPGRPPKRSAPGPIFAEPEESME
jgi:excisionase family DNA binding protein